MLVALTQKRERLREANRGALEAARGHGWWASHYIPERHLTALKGLYDILFKSREIRTKKAEGLALWNTKQTVKVPRLAGLREKVEMRRATGAEGELCLEGRRSGTLHELKEDAQAPAQEAGSASSRFSSAHGEGSEAPAP